MFLQFDRLGDSLEVLAMSLARLISAPVLYAFNLVVPPFVFFNGVDLLDVVIGFPAYLSPSSNR